MSSAVHSKDSALLMLKIRNLARCHSGVRLPLAEEGAAERLIRFCGESDDEQLQHYGELLQALVGEPRGDAVTEPNRVYRGATPPESVSPEGEALSLAEAVVRKPKMVIYRGQTVMV